MASFEETNNPGFDEAMHVPANPGEQLETYPTKTAYNQACKALWEQRARAERAEGLVLEAKQVMLILVKAKSFQEIDDAQTRASGMVGYLRRKLERPVPLQCVADHQAVECTASMVDGRPKERALFNTMRQAEDYAASKRLLGYKVRFDPVYRQADVGDLQRQLANALAILDKLVSMADAESQEDFDPEDRLGELVGAPTHTHEVPGKWDKDGSDCEQCAAWNEARQLLRHEAYYAEE